MDTKRRLIMTIEPSKRLSEILGFPYYIEKKVSLESLHLTEDEIRRLKNGEQIYHPIKAV